MNTPNKLTIARIIATPVFMATVLINFPYHYAVSLLLFIAASLTDLIDGKMARKYNLVTNFGKFLDPLADKMLTTAAYLGFMYMFRNKTLPMIVVTVVTFIVLFREFAVSSVRLVVVSSGGKVIAANIWGKAKTVSQMIGIIAALAFYSFIEIIEYHSLFTIPKFVYGTVDIVIVALFAISGILCVVSGMTYFMGAKDYINPSK